MVAWSASLAQCSHTSSASSKSVPSSPKVYTRSPTLNTSSSTIIFGKYSRFCAFLGTFASCALDALDFPPPAPFAGLSE
eukprot:1183056-Prorocentrum_minimum.AAC.1